MGDIWSVLLLVFGLLVLAVGLVLATGNKPSSGDSPEPSAPPARPGAEGTRVFGPGEISPSAPGEEEAEWPDSRG